MSTLGQKPATQHVSTEKQTITGNGGTSYTLQQSISQASDIEVFVNNTRQEPTVAYTASGTTLTMTGAVNASDSFYVIFQGKAIQTAGLPVDAAITASTISSSGNMTVGGTLGVTGVLTGTSLDISGDIDVDGTTNLDVVDVDGNIDVTGASNSVATLIKPQGALPDNNDNAGLYVLHQGTAGTGLRVRTDNALTGSNFAHILVNNASASTNAFQVSQYGTGLIAKFDKSGTTALSIDNAGHVTKPLQSAFGAYGSGSSTLPINTTYIPPLNLERFDQNADYNTSNYTFTAPVTGKYQLNAVAYLYHYLDNEAGYILMTITCSNDDYQFTVEGSLFGSDITHFHFSGSCLADMDAGDTAVMDLFQQGGTAQTTISHGHTHFNGALIC